MKIDKILYEGWDGNFDEEDEKYWNEKAEKEFQKLKASVLMKISQYRRAHPSFTDDVERYCVAKASLILYGTANKYLDVFPAFDGRTATFEELLNYAEKKYKGAKLTQAGQTLSDLFNQCWHKDSTVRGQPFQIVIQRINKEKLLSPIDGVQFKETELPGFCFPESPQLRVKSLNVFRNFDAQFKKTFTQFKAVSGQISFDKIFLLSSIYPSTMTNKQFVEMISFLRNNGVRIGQVEFGENLVNFLKENNDTTMFSALAKLGVESVVYSHGANIQQKIKEAISSFFEEVVPEHGDAEYVWEDFYEEELKELLQQ